MPDPDATAHAALGLRGPPELTPYVPRVTIEWLRADSEARWRALDGTLAFVDISGFTAMSERLADRGKLGAEEVNEVINRTFTRLLDVAYANGGGLVKFGGDALLLFFDGDDHAVRACRSAHGMRAALREIGRPQTSAGTVELRMHAGLHSDRFHFFLVGTRHRELLLAGPPVTRTVEVESASEAGEILLSETTAAALSPQALGEVKAGGLLLRAAPPPGRGAIAPLPDTAGLDLVSCVPVAVRKHVLHGAVEPEHRQATVAFLRFSGTDELIQRGGPETVADALGELVVRIQAIASEHEVTFLETDIDANGGRIVLVAGAPQSQGEDEERMLRTLRAIDDAGGALPLHIGVNRGRVFAGEVGAPFRRAYTILGDTAAVAARLMAKADAGQILAPAEVLERSRARFDTTELAPLALKGRSEPLAPFAVGPLAAGREVSTETLLPLVGRERETTILGASVAPVRMGFGSFVELVGEAGIGKSRLVAELRELAADLQFVGTACDEYELSTPYFAFRALLRGLLDVPLNGSAASNTERLRERLDRLDQQLLPWIPLLAIPLDVEVLPTSETDELHPAFRRARLHGVVDTLLSKLLPGPTLVVFEDVHWMDEASGDLLRHLGSQVSSKPWLVCETRRPVETGFSAAGGVPPLPALSLRLEPLSADAAAALVGNVAIEALLPEQIEAITHRAGGNPLFLQELVSTPRGAEEKELPESVEAVVTTRIDELSPGDRTLLRYAAVLGGAFGSDLIGAVLEDDPEASADSEAWDRLAEFVERDPYTPGGFRFRHALIRDAAYEGLSYGRRRELHARVGEIYERVHADHPEEYAELLSLHFFHAGIADKAYTYSVVAGERAQAKFANAEAASFYRRALDAAKSLPALEPQDLASIWEALGDVLELSGHYDHAAEAYSQARGLAEHAGDQPALLLKEGLLREKQGFYAEALGWYRRGLEAAEALTSEPQRTITTIDLSLAYGAALFRQGKFAEAIDWYRRVVDDANAVDHTSGLAHAYYLLHLAYTSIGSEERFAFRGLALPVYEELGDLLGQANVLNNLGIDAYYEGRWDESLDLYRRSRELRDRIGDTVGAATISNNIGEIKSDQGQLETAEQLFQEVYDVCSAAGSFLMTHVAESNLARAAARAGRTAEALPLLRKSLAAFHELHAGSFVLETKARLGECAVFAHRPDDALKQVDAALEAIKETGAGRVLLPMLQRVRGYALMQQGKYDAALVALDESLTTAREGGELFEVALTLEAKARHANATGRDPTAEAAESKQLLERLGIVATPTFPL